MYQKRKEIIKNYIEGYNTFNIDQMLQDLHPKISYRNIRDGKEVFSLHGLNKFKKQVEEEASYFSEHHQEIKSISHSDKVTTITIKYSGTVGKDLPNGLEKGQKLESKVKSIFKFKNNKIIELKDI